MNSLTSSGYILSALWFMALSAAGCAKKDVGDIKPTQQSSTDATVDETAAMPNNVSGVYLLCEVQQKATTANLKSIIGCYFANAKGERLKSDKVAAAGGITFNPPTGTKAITSVINLKDDPKFDAVCITKGVSVDEVNSSMAKTMVTAQLTTLPDGKKEAVIGAVLPNVTKLSATGEDPTTAATYQALTESSACQHSLDTEQGLFLDIKNLCGFDIDVMWVGYNCEQISYGQLKTGNDLSLKTYVSHPWRIFRASNGLMINSFMPTTTDDKVVTLCGDGDSAAAALASPH